MVVAGSGKGGWGCLSRLTSWCQTACAPNYSLVSLACCAAWYVAVWCGTVRCDVVKYGTEWYDTYGKEETEMAGHSTAWYSLVRCDIMQLHYIITVQCAMLLCIIIHHALLCYVSASRCV